MSDPFGVLRISPPPVGASYFLVNSNKKVTKEMPPDLPAVSCASRVQPGLADASFRGGQRGPSLARPCGLIRLNAAMLGQANGFVIQARCRLAYFSCCIGLGVSGSSQNHVPSLTVVD